MYLQIKEIDLKLKSFQFQFVCEYMYNIKNSDCLLHYKE
jgi:hypothetical protein